MKIGSRKTTSFLTALIILFVFGISFTGVAMAASDSHGPATAKAWSADDSKKVFNFAVLMTALFVVLRKPVSNALSGRISGIKEELETLEAEKQDALKKLKEYEDKIATLEKEADKILSQYKEQGEAAKQKILDEAKASAEKLSEQAKRNIEHEFKTAKKELQTELMEDALKKAEELIKNTIKAKDQNNLIDDYLKKVVA